MLATNPWLCHADPQARRGVNPSAGATFVFTLNIFSLSMDEAVDAESKNTEDQVSGTMPYNLHELTSFIFVGLLVTYNIYR